MPKVVGYDKTKFKKVTCRNCGAINQYAQNDVRVLSRGRDISQVMCITKGFNCAGCGKEIVTYAD